MRTPACLWKISSGLVLTLQDRFGPPLDAYVNGSQVWLREDGPAEETLEWRLHPVADYAKPPGVETTEVFSSLVFALGNDDEPPFAAESLWGGLECYPAFGDEMEPAILKAAAEHALQVPPDVSGMVDHKIVGDAWERSRGGVSIADLLMQQLQSL